MMVQNLTNFHFNDALDQINQAEYGAHYMIIYPNLDTSREIYSNYAHKQIKENNEIVLINPFYETTDSVRQVLSQKNNNDINNVMRHEKEGALTIADSLQEYLGEQPHMHLKQSLANYAKVGKNGVSVLADMGAYPHKSMYNDLVDYELSLPATYDVQMKGFCLYHQKDFDKFSEEQKQKLIEHHGKALKLIEAK
jgi:MEDS: MEthanogen/methylotroph, DcmR Sensory domain